MLKATNLSIKYGDSVIVDNLNLELDKDEILMLVGPTGCGKTTILQSLAGLIPIASGVIKLGNWCATPTQHIPPEKRNLGVVFQDFALFPHLNVEQNISFRISDHEQVDYWIGTLGLGDLRKAKPATLSGGQKQRVALARTLAHQPELVLLDEPLSSLDAALKDDVRWQIREVLKSAGVPAIWVTHDQDEALSIGDRVGVLKNGRLEQLDTPEVCYSQPANRFVARFLGEASFVDGELDSDMSRVNSALGDALAYPVNSAPGKVTVLLRPDDVSLSGHDSKGDSLHGNGVVRWVRYEGSYRLYAVETDDGAIIKVRCRHENRVVPGARVTLKITTGHPLAVFKNASAAPL